MLAITSVDFSYSTQPVFKNLNISIAQGEFAFLIGKSGSGKSTLLKLIYMDLIPQSGTVEFDIYNSSLIKSNELPFLRRKLGIVFQDFKLLEDRTVYDNLSFVLKLTGTPTKQVKRKIMHSLSDVGLSHKQNNYPSELSGGERQRIAIARAIINEPLLIIADEPTGNLDPETAIEILDIFKKINSRGTSILFATHNYDLVKRIDTKIYKLEDGRAIKAVLKKKAESN
ncbi:MAG: ATP-binding cassette domain-containing protein [Melioribacteraceae bacterium]|nr:ATP-binding cassette domain-containing protein [Melioribacteraceae bacterium]